MKLTRTFLFTLLFVLSAGSWSQQPSGGQLSKFAPAIPPLTVTKSQPVALLLAFDTDQSLNREGYAKFYDHDVKEFGEVSCQYRTLMWTRSGDSVSISADLPLVACPTKTGFTYAGVAGHFQPPAPASKKAAADGDDENLPHFFDCLGVWRTNDPARISAEISHLQQRLAAPACGEKIDDPDTGNLTQHERISFITPNLLSLRGYTSEITGGAALFTATDEQREYGLDDGKTIKLTDLVPAATVNSVFRREFTKQGWVPKWSGGVDIEKYNFAKDAAFTLKNYGGATHLMGLHIAAGNAEREFLAEADFGVAPRSVALYADSGLDFKKFKQIDPKTITMFTSPDRATIFVLTNNSMIVIDSQSKKELFNLPHKLKFNKVVMAEWALGANTARWESELKSAAAQAPASLCPSPSTQRK
ncbi:MAG TPA: hypothetical protein VI636_13915 [Candidatus Angelobacter sp.]